MGLLSFPILSGGVGPRVRHILAVSTPRSEVPASGGSCFVCRGWSECLGVEWEGSLCLGLVFSSGGSGSLLE